MRTIHALDLSNRLYGRWRVLKRSHRNERGEVYWSCRCRCGVERAVKASSLRSGKSVSCGCHHIEAVTTHGMTGTRTFRSWESMKQRCLNPNAPDYLRYGGRGVRVHRPWVDSFEAFLTDLGVRPDGMSLDRHDPNGDYTPENCRWATPTQQMRNRRDSVLITHEGQTLNAYEWATRTGISAKKLRNRLNAGWSPAKTLTTPVNHNLSRQRISKPT